MRRLGAAIGAAVVCATLGLASAPAFGASPSPTSTAGSSAPEAFTLVRLVVRNCNGCTVGVQRGLETEPASKVNPPSPNYWNGPTAKVTNGLAILRVPTAYTPGASFTISAPWEGNTEAKSNIALGGRGAVGKTFTPNQAMDRKRATACWAGTSASTTTINVAVTRATLPGVGGKPATYAVAWASPSVAVLGRLTATSHGMLGNQDMYFC